MKLRKISNFLIKLYPLKTQEEWDLCGLKIYEDLMQKIDNVVVCLDITSDLVDFALANKVNLIISHHPLFETTENFTVYPQTNKIINRLKQNNIAALFLHTCFDKATNGMNECLAQALELSNIKRVPNSDYLVVGTLSNAIDFNTFVRRIKLKLNLDEIYALESKRPRKFNNVVICGGSGFSQMETLIENKKKNSKEQYDVFLTGDVKWHNWLDSNENGIYVIDIGHIAEKIFIKKIVADLKSEYGRLNILSYEPKIKIKQY